MIVICVPVVRRARKPGQDHRILDMRDALAGSLARVSNSPLRYQIRLVLNGPPVDNDFAAEMAHAFSELPSLGPRVTVDVVSFERAGKIAAINRAILDPDARGIVVVDDDVLVPLEAFPEIDKFLRVRRQHLEALCFPKAPINNSASTTAFNSQLTFLLHPSTQRVLMKMEFFRPNRPSGSLYAIHGNHLKPFPFPCNEADVLATRRLKVSCHFVRTWYPPSFEEEVARRAAHLGNTLNSGHRASAKSLELSSAYDRIGRAFIADLPLRIHHRIWQSLETMKAVIVAAEKEVTRAEYPKPT